MIVKPSPAEDFRYRVILQSRDVSETNELGETVPAVTALATVWAKVSPLSAKEVIQNSQNQMELSHEVRIRYNADLTHADSILFKDRTLEIVSLIDIEEQHVELLILCNEQK